MLYGRKDMAQVFVVAEAGAERAVEISDEAWARMVQT
jgi:hypothetical protein